MTTVKAYAVREKSGLLSPFEYSLNEIEPDRVDIKVESCGICHSDLAMIDNEWRMSKYPIVPGHEVIGIITAKGKQVKHLRIGQRVGLGWFSGSCMFCHNCLSGDHNLCAKAEQTIIGRNGGFADLIRANALWAIPLPESLAAKDAGPLFCGGITVFNPIIQLGIRPTQKVGVIGIGGLGHLALQFLNKWGCEVTAFSSTDSKEEEARQMGAHHFINSKDDKVLASLAGKFDLILNTANANLNWAAYIAMLRARGHLHTVGAVMGPISFQALQLIPSQLSISGSPLGSPATIQDMLEFCARHNIQPLTEHFAMKDVNEALNHLREGKARYRVILDN
ncbi:MAG: NAD(P)-dependent alcohol dehydrogenase [Tatlockia sp.]|nr:NAD(P)-dependent alcohol dehydrogenase [Tatlockia sp.]